MKIKETKKDKELGKLLSQHPKKMDVQVIIDTLLNWEEKSAMWLFYLTQMIEKIDATEEQKTALIDKKNKVLEDETLSKQYEEFIGFVKNKENEKDEDEIKLNKLEEMGFKPLLTEEYHEIIAKKIGNIMIIQTHR